jgi:hypothetical protein
MPDEITLSPVVGDTLLTSLTKSVKPTVAQAILGIGRSKMYEELGRGNLDAVRDDSRIFITVESIIRYQANRPKATFAQSRRPRSENLAKLPRRRRRKSKAVPE